MLKKYILNFVLTFTILLLNNSFHYAESEPNNTWEQANLIAPNGSYSGSLDNIDIVDWWKITVPSDGKLVVATLSDAALEIDNYIYDQDGISQIASYAYGGSHTWDTTYFNNLIAGTYYIRTTRYSGGGAYTIANNFIPAGYPNDPEINDSAQVATILSMNGSTTGHLGYYSSGYTDVYDWWKVTVPSDGKLVIATQSDPTLEIDNYIYDKDKKTQIASYAYGGSHTWDTTYFVNLVPGTYYILSFRYRGYGSYTITNSFTPANFQNDPEINDSVQVATPLILNGSSTGHLGFYSLGYTDLYDWWKVTVPSDGKLVVATQSDPTIEIDNYLYDQDKTTQIASYAYGGSHTWDTTYFNNLVPGTYYILSFRYRGYGSYSIANNFIPAGLENDSEPNDSIPVAKNINVNTLSTGHLGYYNRGNVDRHDYFYFTTTSVWDTLFIRTDSSPTLELDLYLYNSSGEWISQAGAYGTSELLVFANLQPGTYFVNAYRYSGYGSYGLLATNVRPNIPLVNVENSTVDVLLKDFELKQNYPNPFNPSTTISYQLPVNSNVTLKVYNTLGQEIETLIDEFQNAGFHSTLYTLHSSLPSGVYFYQLRANNFVSTKKFILMK